MNKPKEKGKDKPRFRVPSFNPETDNSISYLQVVYGQYKNNFPVIKRYWVYEDFYFVALKEEEMNRDAWRYSAEYNMKVCGQVVKEKRSKLELQIIEKVKNKEFRIAWNHLTGWNLFKKKPSKAEMEFLIFCQLKDRKKRKGHR